MQHDARILCDMGWASGLRGWKRRITYLYCETQACEETLAAMLYMITARTEPPVCRV